MIACYFTQLVHPYQDLKNRYLLSSRGMFLMLIDIITYRNTYQLFRTILPLNSTRRYLPKSYLTYLLLKYNGQEQVWELLYIQLHNMIHYPTGGDIGRTNTILPKNSIEILSHIIFVQIQDPFTATWQVRYTVISLV